MWIPGIISIILRIITNDWKDIGLGLGKAKFYSIAFFIPCIGAFLSALICSIFDIRVMSMVTGVPVPKVILQFSFIFIIGFASALGEELGWRGYLVPKIYQVDLKYPTLTTGFIWALWHIPIVAFSGYYQTLLPWQVIIFYTLAIFGLNYFINWIRLNSGSMWTATLTHASYNFFFQTFWLYFLFSPPGKNVHLWEGIGGDVGVIPITFLLIIFLLGHFKFRWNLSKLTPKATSN